MLAFWKFLLRISKWKVEGSIPPELKKFIIIVAPHTSNWDFIIGVIVRGTMGFKAKYLGKESLFRFPFGRIFRALGGIPVDRSNSHQMVRQIAGEVRRHSSFVLAIAPEGTRRRVSKWRTGFYYIADKAGIPIVPVQLNWTKRAVIFLSPFYTTGNIERDMPMIKSLFKDVSGRHEFV